MGAWPLVRLYALTVIYWGNALKPLATNASSKGVSSHKGSKRDHSVTASDQLLNFLEQHFSV